jgi:hypothetical protein
VTHPQLIRRGDRRALLAAGAAAVFLMAPAADALPVVGTLDCTAKALAGDTLLYERCVQAGLLPPAPAPSGQAPAGLGVPVPEAVGSVVDPIEKVVDDVLQKPPAPVGEAVEQIPPVVDGVVEALPVQPPPVDVPVLTPEAPPADVAPAETAVRPVRPPVLQGPGYATPPFLRRGVPTTVTTTAPRRAHTFTPPVVSGPFFGDVARVAEEFVSSRSPIATGLDAFTDRGTSTVPGPDASSWLFATAGGMLLLLGAGHLLHARQRYAASVAR